MKILARYRLEFLFALVVSLLCGLPSVIMKHKLHAEGRIYAPLVVTGVTALTYDEATCYAPSSRAALDGDLLTGDPEGYEHEDDPPRLGRGPLASWVGAVLGRLAGGSVPDGYELSRWFLPALCFFLTALACRQLGASAWVAVSASLLAIVAHDQLNLPLKLLISPHSVNLADHLHLFSSQRPIEYMRFPHPSLSWIFCIGALMALRALITSGKPLYIPLFAILLAALYYSYVFFWTFVVVVAILYGLWSGVTGRGRAALYVLLGLVIGSLLGAPVIAQALSPESYGFEAVNSRLAWGGAGITLAKQKFEIVLWLIFLIIYPKRRPEFPYLLAVAIAPYACVFGAKAVGQSLQDWHWIGRCWYIWMCLCFPLALWAISETPYSHPLLARMAGGLHRSLTGIAVALSVLVLAYGFNDHIRYALELADRYTLTRGQDAAFHWLNAHADADDVVMSASSETLALLPIYSHCNIYRPYALMTPADDEEQAKRFFITSALLKIKPAAIDRMLQPDDWLSGRTDGMEWWGIEWMYHTEAGVRGLPPKMIPTFNVLRHQMPTWDPLEIVDFYRVDYVWFGPFERQVSALDPEKTPWLTRVFNCDDVALYAVNPDRLFDPDKNAAYLEADQPNAQPTRHRHTKVRRRHVPRQSHRAPAGLDGAHPSISGP